MRNIDPDLSLELAKEVYRELWLLDIETAVPLRFTDLDIPIYYGGNRYTPRGMKFPNIKYAAAMSVDKAEIEIGDADGVIIASFLLENVRNKTVVISHGALNAGYQIIATQEIFRGYLDEWDKLESQMNVTVTNEFIMWQKKTLRTASATCPWIFKGGAANPECGYTGSETWCDRSYERCVALGNQLNFGGDRFIPSFAGKPIWWGRVPK